MLKTICYVSNKIDSIAGQDLNNLLERIILRNNQLGITGLMLLKNNQFFQIMEGHQSDVDELFRKIEQDKRHYGMVVLLNQPLEQRIFADYESGNFTLINDEERFKKVTSYFEWIKNAGLIEIDKIIILASNFLKHNK